MKDFKVGDLFVAKKDFVCRLEQVQDYSLFHVNKDAPLILLEIMPRNTNDFLYRTFKFLYGDKILSVDGIWTHFEEYLDKRS